ncbi:hypothetical protein [Legionella cincinnatiensis]|uniref:Dot/Icm secretion system substrate n=1 Tax=Legionella cincinnatiensis TaxID=28085 RepID=A0A378IFL5_9GAMM|nr:hypothetical protein [Legionella cincinnatiensis]KTC92144.1 substrate of the Dot/Icm secretion system [Legionella cincinnatiensis]STX33552.1 Dot/Icm secretion system substrate [Legionella cincinnatiensis]
MAKTEQEVQEELQKKKQQQQQQDPPLTVPKKSGAPEQEMSNLVVEEQEKEEKKKQSVLIQSADMERLLKDYKRFCEKQKPPIEFNEDKLKPDGEGKVNFDFKTPEQMTDFFKQQAADGHRFVMIDAETNKVLAYSNGDGKLYRPGLGKDKEPEEITGKSLLPTKEQMKDLPDHKGFEMPEPTSSKLENK